MLMGVRGEHDRYCRSGTGSQNYFETLISSFQLNDIVSSAALQATVGHSHLLI